MDILRLIAIKKINRLTALVETLLYCVLFIVTQIFTPAGCLMERLKLSL